MKTAKIPSMTVSIGYPGWLFTVYPTEIWGHGALYRLGLILSLKNENCLYLNDTSDEIIVGDL